MQAARHETTSWEEMALEPIDQNQQTTPPDTGLSPYPDMGGPFEVTGSETSVDFPNSAVTMYLNADFHSFSVPYFPIEASVENGNFLGMNMNAIELDFFNGFPSVDYANVIAPNQPAPMLGPAIYPPPFINPGSASYLPVQVPVQQPVLPSGQQAPQRTTCTRCPRTFSRRSDLPRHMASVHGVGRRAHQCPRPGCGKTYSRSDKVLEHRRNAGH
ncbi:hypothetical protein BELL_0555g00070 [Botrytis elliptica]|uniref:C2H2-type domain-containing protein n=1 Tax=Botrytis elliptica TaxID=278938 RepID=A0A4Z1JDH2_9HELO|nr:hypothetical protein EAE99_004856 [Botrytis elliptica]TGO71586.1 hypothetical protein BELL_0555g00070 [Botrytis elliptica]